MTQKAIKHHNDDEYINADLPEVTKVTDQIESSGHIASNDEFEKDTTYVNCKVGWTHWSPWFGDIPGAPTKVEYSGATVSINKTGKTAKIEVYIDGELKTFNKRVATKGFYFKKLKKIKELNK